MNYKTDFSLINFFLSQILCTILTFKIFSVFLLTKKEVIYNRFATVRKF